MTKEKSACVEPIGFPSSYQLQHNSIEYKFKKNQDRYFFFFTSNQKGASALNTLRISNGENAG